MKALVAGRSAIHRAGVAKFLRQLVGGVDCREVDCLDHAIDVVLGASSFEIAILDLPAISGEALYQLRMIGEAIDPAPVLAVSSFSGRWEVLRALEFGATGCLNRSASGEETLTALQRMLDGELWAPSRLLVRTDSGTSESRRGQASAHGSRGGSKARLTRQQVEILRHLREGKTNRQIARLVDVSPHTVRYHVSAILRALEVANRTEAAMLANTVLRCYRDA